MKAKKKKTAKIASPQSSNYSFLEDEKQNKS